MIVRYHFHNGYCGCDQEEVMFYENDTPAREIDQDCQQWGLENADSYAYVHFGWDEEYTDEEYENYLYDCDFGWHPITWEEYVEYCENWSLTPNEAWRE
jgi:hypothetical protein